MFINHFVLRSLRHIQLPINSVCLELPADALNQRASQLGVEDSPLLHLSFDLLFVGSVLRSIFQPFDQNILGIAIDFGLTPLVSSHQVLLNCIPSWTAFLTKVLQVIQKCLVFSLAFDELQGLIGHEGRFKLILLLKALQTFIWILLEDPFNLADDKGLCLVVIWLG